MGGAAKRVPGYDYLYQRGSRYLVRVQVPADVRATLGRTELKTSLGGDFALAKRTYHATVASLIAKVDNARSGVLVAQPMLSATSLPSRERIEAACYAYYRRMIQNMRGKVAQPTGDKPGERLNRIEGYQFMIQNHLDVLEQDAWTAMSAEARWLCEEQGWAVDEDGEGFEFLSRTILRARLQCYREELRRLEGKMGVDPDADPLFGPEPPVTKATGVTLGDLIDQFNAERGGKWSASTQKNYIIITRVLEEVCGRETLVSAIDKGFCQNVRSILSSMPANYQKLPATKGRSIVDAIRVAEIHGLAKISPATINGHLNKLGALVRFGKDAGWIVGNPMANVDVHDPVHPSEKRDPLSIEQLGELFSTTPWGQEPPSATAKYPSRYWAPLIALFSGARLTDICGQRLDEMIEENGVPLFHFAHRPGDRHIKGGRGRKVPVHPELVRAGFLDYVADAREQGQEYLFRDVKRDKLGKWGDATSKWFARKLVELSFTGRNLSFHSFRHSFEDALRRADLHDTPIGNAITGRWSPGVSKNYGSKYPVEQLSAAIIKVEFSGFRFVGRGAEDAHSMLSALGKSEVPLQ